MRAYKPAALMVTRRIAFAAEQEPGEHRPVGLACRLSCHCCVPACMVSMVLGIQESIPPLV
eukprot:NODE_24454_length_624_cov_5.175050.p5 GENE.NODE_24454_length_624_cov_5.175050~~NODE_24454_length_624_cov_5.175050.p5  ORF type:complete len:61 (-),score=6.49 NODE_24454_length_624_cov_5.175050:154-336(-)